jgi:hypothetical protein
LPQTQKNAAHGGVEHQQQQKPTRNHVRSTCLVAHSDWSLAVARATSLSAPSMPGWISWIQGRSQCQSCIVAIVNHLNSCLNSISVDLLLEEEASIVPYIGMEETKIDSFRQPTSTVKISKQLDRQAVYAIFP